MKSKLYGQTDAHIDYSAHLWVVQCSIRSLENIVVIGDLYLHFFNLKYGSAVAQR